MKTDWNKWSAIAEVVSGLAVVATLVFLILEIRGNSDIARASAYANAIDSIVDVEIEALKDPELSLLTQAFFSGRLQGLDERGLARVNQFVTIMFRQYENAYFFQSYGLFGESEWDRFERQMCSNFAIAKSTNLAERIEQITTSEYFEFLGSCSERL